MYLLKQLIATFLFALLFFILIIQLVDLFANLVQYLRAEASIIDIIYIQWLYLPKCLSYSFPIALLFAVSFTLGTFYTNNELISLLNAGVPLVKLILPFLVFGLLLSFFSFFFEDQIVIPYTKWKNEISRQVLRTSISRNNSKVTVLGADNRHFAHAEFYNDTNKSVLNAHFVEMDENSVPVRHVYVEKADWNPRERTWNGTNVRIFENEKGEINESFLRKLTIPTNGITPEGFLRNTNNIDELKLKEAKEIIFAQKKAGLPFLAAETDYYSRYSFALTCIIVCIISAATGGWFKKNILLMSLLQSLSISVFYYVFHMIAVLAGKLGYVPSFVGAFAASVFFFAVGIILLRFART